MNYTWKYIEANENIIYYSYYINVTYMRQENNIDKCDKRLKLTLLGEEYTILCTILETLL